MHRFYLYKLWMKDRKLLYLVAIFGIIKKPYIIIKFLLTKRKN